MTPRTALCLAALFLAAAAPSRAQNFTLLTVDMLPYSLDATEPAIDAETQELHWTKHANAFVTNLNNALQGDCKDSIDIGGSDGERVQKLSLATGTDDLPESCATVIRNNAGGLWNHLLFFLHNLAPYGSQTYEEDASEDLKNAVDRDLGGYESMMAAFNTSAAGVFGSGWAWLVVDPDSKELSVTSTGNQDNPVMTLPKPSTGANATTPGLPILSLDVWEHGYYLMYRNVRPAYIGNFSSVINWQGVSALYDAAWNDTYEQLDVSKPSSADYGN